MLSNRNGEWFIERSQLPIDAENLEVSPLKFNALAKSAFWSLIDYYIVGATKALDTLSSTWLSHCCSEIADNSGATSSSCNMQGLLDLRFLSASSPLQVSIDRSFFQMINSVGSNHSHPGLEITWDTHVIPTMSDFLCENTKRLLLNAVVFLDQSLRR